MTITVIVEGYGPVDFPDGMSKGEMAEALRKLSPQIQESIESDEKDLLPEIEPLVPEMTQGSTKEDLLKEYNAKRTGEQTFYGGVGAGAGFLGGALTGRLPKATLPEAKETLDLERKLSEIQNASQLEKNDLLRKLRSSGVDVSDLDNARLLEEAAPRLEAQLGAAEARATAAGSALRPTINTAPISSMPDIADIVQHSTVATGGTNVPVASALARETGQHELAHLRSQAGKEASRTAEQVAKARGTSYGQVLTGPQAHMPTPSGRVLVPQELGTKMAEEAIQALKALTPERLAAEAEVRRLQALGKDTSILTRKIAELQKQETLAVQALMRAESMQPGILTRTGMATGKFPKISGALGGAGTALSAYDLSQAETPGEFVLGGINTGLGAMSMVPPVNPASAAVRGFGALGSLGMLPINVYMEKLRREGKFGRGSVMDKQEETQ